MEILCYLILNCTDFFVLITAMQSRVQVLAADIHQHAAKKKTAFKAGPSRPSKKGRTVASSASVREFDVLSALVSEPVLALSASTMLLEIPSAKDGTIGEDRATAVPSMAPSTEVRAEMEVTVELEQSTAVPTIPIVEPSQTQSSVDFPTFSSTGLPTRDRRKALETSTDDGSTEGLLTLIEIWISEDESALVNPELARRLIEATILLTDWENRKNRTIIEMLSSFYLMILEVSSSTYLFLYLI